MQKHTEKALEVLRREVKAAIAKRGQTVEQFCWENDLNKATVSNFLNNKKDFRVSTLARIAAALGRDLEIQLK